MAGDRINQANICEKAKQSFEEFGAKAPSISTGPMKEFALGCGPGTDYP